jgi:hypothetical protein
MLLTLTQCQKVIQIPSPKSDAPCKWAVIEEVDKKIARGLKERAYITADFVETVELLRCIRLLQID